MNTLFLRAEVVGPFCSTKKKESTCGKKTCRSDSSSPCSKLCRLSGPELLLLAAVETPPPAAARAAATVEGRKQQQRKQKLIGSGSCRCGVVRAAAPAARLEERPTPSAATATAPTARGPAPGVDVLETASQHERQQQQDQQQQQHGLPACPTAAAAAFGLGGAAAGPDLAAELGDTERSWRLRNCPYYRCCASAAGGVSAVPPSTAVLQQAGLRLLLTTPSLDRAASLSCLLKLRARAGKRELLLLQLQRGLLAPTTGSNSRPAAAAPAAALSSQGEPITRQCLFRDAQQQAARETEEHVLTPHAAAAADSLLLLPLLVKHSSGSSSRTAAAACGNVEAAKPAEAAPQGGEIEEVPAAALNGLFAESTPFLPNRPN
ncbi:hypothetical protein Emag_000001 [Eimeria magna]